MNRHTLTGNTLARKLTTYVVLLSLFATLVGAAILLYMSYRQNMEQVSDSFNQIKLGYLDSLIDNIWIYNDNQVKIQLDGMLGLTGVEYVDIKVEGEIAWSSGTIKSDATMEEKFDLIYRNGDDYRSLGTMSVVVGLDYLHNEVHTGALAALLISAIMSFLIAGIILLIFRTLVTRHMTTVAKFVNTFELERNKGAILRLNRPSPTGKKADELDLVVDAINNMQRNLLKSTKQIQESNSLLSSILDSPDNVIMFALDNSYNYLSFNKAHIRTMKKVYDADIKIGQNVLSYIPNEDDRLKAAKNYVRVLRGERFIEIEEYGLSENRFWYELIFNPITDISNHITGFTVYVTDITDRRHAEEKLKKTTYDLGERLKELNCLYCISKLVDKENITIEEILQGIADIIPPSWQYPEITCAQITRDGQSYKSDNFKETKWLQVQKIIASGMKAGEVKVFYLEEKPEIDEGPFLKEERDLINAIALRIGHIIEEKQAEAEKGKLESRLQQAQKMEAIGTLAGGIAHDFNNILGAIIGYTEMARDDSPNESSIAKDLDKVLEASTRATDLVKQILAFSRQDETEYILLQPSSIVEKAISMIRPSLPTTIKINRDIDPETGLIFADPTQIYQILMNLCTNAFHAMEKTGGKLDISLKETILGVEDLTHESGAKAGTFVQLSICDSGHGIAPDIKDNIFDPYFTTKETGKGTGMGLAIIHGIVKNYGGFITLYSALGEGTAFHVFLPVIEKDTLPEIKTVEQFDGGKERVLLIDDEEILADMGKDMLERLGYHVTVRKSSLDALETFQNQPDQFDIVITDQTMPGMTGIDLARRMLQIRPNIPIILCTGYSSIISEEKAKSMGIKEFALKPLTKMDIAVLIRKVLGNN